MSPIIRIKNIKNTHHVYEFACLKATDLGQDRSKQGIAGNIEGNS
jgi:hypothetical protein